MLTQTKRQRQVTSSRMNGYRAQRRKAFLIKTPASCLSSQHC